MADVVAEATDDAVVTIELDPSIVLPGEEGGDEGVVAAEPKPDATPEAKTSADDAATALLDAQARADKERKAREASDAQADAERRRADQERRRADTATEAARAAQEEASTGRLAIVTAEIGSVTRDMQAAKSAYKAAHEAGDADKMADAQEGMSTAAAALDRLKVEKTNIEANPNPTPAQRGGAVEAEPAADKFEQYLTVNNFDPTAQRWLRQHKEYAPAFAGGDAEKNATMMEGHYGALRQKITPNTPQYFEFLEKHIAGEEATPPAPQPKPKPAVALAPPARKVPIAAAPSREATPGAPQLTTRNVRLNAQQQEAALISYPANPGENEDAWRKRAFGVYATEYVKAVAEGKIGRLTH